MTESKIFDIDFTNVEDHAEQWAKLLDNNDGLKKILEVVKKPGKALVFSHDDPDGITSGLICKRMLLKKGWKVKHYMPEGFKLQPEQFEKALKEFPEAECVFILDKGTSDADDFISDKLPCYVVDHHPAVTPPVKNTFFNPGAKSYVQCSGSVLAHGISVLAGTREEFDDLLALIGLKGDWAIEPVSGACADFVRPFFKKYALDNFKNLFTFVKERPTMFDASQRDGTCVISLISEVIHGCGGGGFSYFYNDREPALKDVLHPDLCAKALEEISGKVDEIKKVRSVKDFISLIPEKEQALLKKIWNYFLEDWEKASSMLDSSARILKLEDTSIYLFVGPKVPLLPMIGSIKLFDLKAAGKDKLAQIIMVSAVSDSYTHVSVRATGNRVHSGMICNELQDTLRERYPESKQFISGGGHPVAAECTVKTDKVTFLNVLTRVTEVLNEMSSIDKLYTNGALNETQKAKAKQLGLDYIK